MLWFSPKANARENEYETHTNKQKLIFKTAIRNGRQPKLCQIVATTQTSRVNIAPPGVQAVVPIVPPGDLGQMSSSGLISGTTLSNMEYYKEQNANEADRGVHDFMCELTTCENP